MKGKKMVGGREEGKMEGRKKVRWREGGIYEVGEKEREREGGREGGREEGGWEMGENINCASSELIHLFSQLFLSSVAVSSSHACWNLPSA